MIWILVCLLLSGCIGIQDTIIHEHIWDKETGKCWLCKAVYNPIPQKEKEEKIKFNAKNIIIRAIIIEAKISESKAMVLWERYKNSGEKRLSDYLIKTNPLELQDSYYIDLAERIKARSKIIARNRKQKKRELQAEAYIIKNIKGKNGEK